MRRRLLPVALVVMLALAWAAPAHALRLSPADPGSPNAEGIESAWWVMLVVACALVVIVNAALIAAAIRFRERRGREPRRFSAGRGALRPALAGLSLLALAIFVYGVVVTVNAREIEPSGPNGLGAAQTAQVGVSGLPSAEAIEGTESATGEEPISGAEPGETSPLLIDAIAQQWLWRFEYPGEQPAGRRTYSYSELVVPVDTTVILNITSTDVLHTWWIPDLGGQVQAAPGDVTQTWFKADEVGRYEGRSTIFSGTGYPVMRAWVRVLTVPEYEDYVEQLTADLTDAQGIVAEDQAKQAALGDTAAAEATP